MSATGTFATAINCMDGRTQEPIITYMKQGYKVDYVDMINEPGPVKALAENTNFDILKKLADIELQVSRIKADSKKKFEQAMNVVTFAEVGEHETAGNLVDVAILESIQKRMNISVNLHGSKVVAVVAHHDCAGNPVAKEKQIEQLNASVKTLKSWGFAVEYIKLWVDNNWRVQLIN
jgi:carbonic anhydrase